MASELDFLLRFPLQPHVVSPVDFLSNSSWGGIRSLSAKDEFRYSTQAVCYGLVYIFCRYFGCTEYCGGMVTTPALYSGGLWFVV